MTLTPFELDIAAQPDALRAIAAAPLPASALALAARPWDRIVFTGMGSSHFAGIPSWRSLVARGRAAWAVDTGRLLDSPELLTPETLLVVTSQSGASGEVTELLSRRGDDVRVGAVLGITADGSSPLGRGADAVVPLHSGSEATVSTKSYLNTLVAHALVIAAASGATTGEDAGVEAVRGAAARLADTIADLVDGDTASASESLAAAVLSPERPRLVAVGRRDDAATALFAGLITKESSKVAIEGHIGGQFRHGPFELAGPGLTAFLYGATTGDASTVRLARDLIATGSRVVLIGDLELDGATTLHAPRTTALEALATGAVVAELLAVAIARENGVVPGAFAFGSKVTTAL